MSAVSKRLRKLRRACDREASRQAEQGRLDAEGRAAWEADTGVPFPPFDTGDERLAFVKSYLSSEQGLQRVGPECGAVIVERLEYVRNRDKGDVP